MANTKGVVTDLTLPEQWRYTIGNTNDSLTFSAWFVIYQKDESHWGVMQQVSKVFNILCEKFEEEIRFFKVLDDTMIEECVIPCGLKPEWISKTPLVVFFQSQAIIQTMPVTRVPDIVKACEAIASQYRPPAASQDELNARLKSLIESKPTMLFMKGDRNQPFCKFSKQAVDVFRDEKYREVFDTPGCDWGHFDIFTDEEVRQGLKVYSDWPTFPQLYINGEMMGGVDILLEMHEDGSLLDELKATLPKDDQHQTRWQSAGSAAAGGGVDTSNDPPEWATNGLDRALNAKLQSIIKAKSIMLFMKGERDQPFCKFSKLAVGMLNEYTDDWGGFNILADEEVRQGLKVYSDWPTFPQLYVNGELMGGVDIIQELHDEGSLREELGLGAEA